MTVLSSRPVSTSMSRILCDNSGVSQMQPFAFLAPESFNPVISCSQTTSIPRPSLEPWRENNQPRNGWFYQMFNAILSIYWRNIINQVWKAFLNDLIRVVTCNKKPISDNFPNSDYVNMFHKSFWVTTTAVDTWDMFNDMMIDVCGYCSDWGKSQTDQDDSRPSTMIAPDWQHLERSPLCDCILQTEWVGWWRAGGWQREQCLPLPLSSLSTLPLDHSTEAAAIKCVSALYEGGAKGGREAGT